MPIYDNDGTTTHQIGKLYDNDSTTTHQIGKVYDHDGTTNSLIYTAETILPALSTPWAYSGDPYAVVYSDYASTGWVDCSEGETISCMVTVWLTVSYTKEYGISGAACVRILRQTDSGEVVVFDYDRFNVYDGGHGFCSAWNNYAGSYSNQSELIYTIPLGAAGRYRVDVRAAVQRDNIDIASPGAANAKTSEITIK